MSFCLEDYDCIGFDFDHTLLRYDAPKTLDYFVCLFSEFISKRLGFDCTPPNSTCKEFMQPGLFFDAKRGNFLKIAADYRILRASHGTRFLGADEIRKVYGKDALYPKAKEFIEKESKGSCFMEGNICFTDIFTTPINLIYANMVDQFDARGVKEYPWMEALIALKIILDPKTFVPLGFADRFKQDVDSLVDYTSLEKSMSLIKDLKKNGNKKVFIITSGIEYQSNYLFTKVFGSDWTKYIDIVIGSASKPDLFGKDCKVPFSDETGSNEVRTPLEVGGHYSKGNYTQLYSFFQRETGKECPRILYVGDDIYGDVFGAGKMAANCEAVAILNENAQSYAEFKPIWGFEEEYWGSMFYDVDEKGQKVRTLWTKVLEDNAKIIVPSLDHFLQKPWNHKHEHFYKKLDFS